MFGHAACEEGVQRIRAGDQLVPPVHSQYREPLSVSWTVHDAAIDAPFSDLSQPSLNGRVVVSFHFKLPPVDQGAREPFPQTRQQFWRRSEFDQQVTAPG